MFLRTISYIYNVKNIHSAELDTIGTKYLCIQHDIMTSKAVHITYRRHRFIMSYDINVQKNQITIGDTTLHYPISFDNFNGALGNTASLDGNLSDNLIYLWNKNGIRAFVDKETNILSEINIIFSIDVGFEGRPESAYDGQVLIDGKPLTSLVTITPETGSFDDQSYNDVEFAVAIDKSLAQPITTLILDSLIENSAPETAKESTAPILAPKADHPIIFTDFNFKLAILNELMFGENPQLEPFKLSEFVSSYSERNIDIDLEGYDPMPEVVRYFEAYEVDEKYAPSITSLYLDGGNDIYLEIAPLWGGDTPFFDIEDFSDVTHFPNLKEITNELFPLSASLEEQLKAKNISII